MPRFHLTFAALWLVTASFGQVKIKDLIKFGDEQYIKGDYFYAIQLYAQAHSMDSSSLELHWKQAETQRAYKNYAEAAKWYAKVYAEDAEKKYSNSILYYALMVKQTGDYAKALGLFKKAYKELADYPDENSYKKAKQEIKSTEFAIKNKIVFGNKVQAMPDSINSYDAEFGHAFRDGVFYFSSLKADSISTNEEVYTKFYRTRTYLAAQDSASFRKPKQWESLSIPQRSTGNGSFDKDGWYYYSVCDDKGYNYRCKIVRYRELKGKPIIDTLPEIINAAGFNTTNPCWVALKNGKAALFFSSDREGGNGGMDIWYAIQKNNGTFDTPKNIASINSIENEITPWYDEDSSKLYFSSTWHFGYGGYDVFSSDANDKFQFSKPKNVGIPLNNSANDLYYFRQGDSVFVSTNRLGSLYKKNPTCCSDIYYAVVEPPVKNNPPDTLPPPTPPITFPVKLYFRNDYPNPKSYAKKSSAPYDVLYQDYLGARQNYLDSALDKSKLGAFFTEEVDQGYFVLQKLYDSVVHEIARGNSILLFSRGYASPLNVTQYNVNLTQRRISSVYRFFMEHQNNQLKKLLDKNKSVQFEIVEVPLGEYAANQSTSDDINDRVSSVYSTAASIERKVEILYMARSQSEALQKIEASPLVQEEEIKEGTMVTKRISLTHDVSELEVSEVKFNQEGLVYKLLPLGENESEMAFQFTPEFSGKHASCFADIFFEGIEEPVRVYFTFVKK
ncbi:MAG: tetratricopeptide repeat protein [Bacteroidota bacterium]